MNEIDARKLSRRIKKSWQDLEKLLNEAITGNIWTPLGYESFTEWYDSELQGVPLALGARNMVVVIMLSEEYATQREIAHMVGVHESVISRIRRSWNAGMLTGFLPPIRKLPERRAYSGRYVHLATLIEREFHHEIKQWAKDHGLTLQDVQKDALELYAKQKIRRGLKFKPATPSVV